MAWPSPFLSSSPDSIRFLTRRAYCVARTRYADCGSSRDTGISKSNEDAKRGWSAHISHVVPAEMPSAGWNEEPAVEGGMEGGDTLVSEEARSEEGRKHVVT